MPDALLVGQKLATGERLTSANGKYHLLLKDGEFKMSEGDTKIWFWKSFEANQIVVRNDGEPAVIVMMRDDRFNVEDPFWQVNASPMPMPDLCLQVLDEGVAVVKAAGVVRWSSHPEKVPMLPVVASEGSMSAITLLPSFY